MKNWVKTVPGKIIVFLVCCISLWMCATSVLGIGVLAYLGGYRASEETVFENVAEQKIQSRAWYLSSWDFTLGETRQFEDDGNLIYEILDEEGKPLARSESAGAVSNWIYTDTFDGGVINNSFQLFYGSGEPYTITFRGALKEGLPETDFFSFAAWLLHIGMTLRYAFVWIAGIGFLLAISSFVVLMCVSGRHPNEEALFPGKGNKIPGDIFALCLITVCVLLVAICFQEYGIVFLPFAVIGDTLLVLWLCMNLAVRIKEGTLFTNTLCWKIWLLCVHILKWGWNTVKKLCSAGLKGISMLPLVWKTAVGLLVLAFVEFCFIVAGDGRTDVFLFFFLVEKVVLIPGVLYLAICLRKLQQGGRALAKGDLSYHTDTRKLFWDFKEHGENLNSIALGMTSAVEERLKSERMKTELITNVSHDIKTPLTSIINYATLIGNETCDNERITEYSGVLVRQSERLKRLIEDLVEASKASTGNLDVCLAPCDASVFLSQAVGEYEEKLQSHDLTLIVRQPEEEVRIMADGRRMWRIFDNLMNNICKYAQPGTRVYLSLEREGNDALISFKNISAQPLDISAEVLMERFVRGDTSRNTEGNGLGLSIAQSMAQLQKGSMTLTVDGDLFKAVLRFPML